MEINDNSLAEVALINLYTLGKDTHELCFKQVDFKDKSHLFLINLAMSTYGVHKYKIYLDCHLIDFIKFKIKNYKSKTYYGYFKKNTIDINKFLRYISNANKKTYSVWSKLYDEYYGEK